jgi:hypothetical protein
MSESIRRPEHVATASTLSGHVTQIEKYAHLAQSALGALSGRASYERLGPAMQSKVNRVAGGIILSLQGQRGLQLPVAELGPRLVSSADWSIGMMVQAEGEAIDPRLASFAHFTKKIRARQIVGGNFSQLGVLRPEIACSRRELSQDARYAAAGGVMLTALNGMPEDAVITVDRYPGDTRRGFFGGPAGMRSGGRGEAAPMIALAGGIAAALQENLGLTLEVF